MIVFDYGQTLANARKFDGVKGTKAVLQYATTNKYGYTAEEVLAAANETNKAVGRFHSSGRDVMTVEIPNHMFTAYLYQSLGIELSLTPQEIDRVFWNEAGPAVPTNGVEDFLDFLKSENIRTGVISNISFCGEIVAERINNLLPNNNFEFIIASSEYMFRKPHRRIFDLALEKAGLDSNDVWNIGDNYDCDILGSKAAGLFPVWYLGATERITDQDDTVLHINHWKELEDVIRMATYHC